MSQRELSIIQQKIYQYISETNKHSARSPSRREIMKKLNIKSYSNLDRDLNALAGAGLIELIADIDYGIRLPKSGILLEGSVGAGGLIEKVDDNNELSETLESVLEDKRNYALLVKGDSMIDADILDGDYVIIRKQPTCENGEIAVAVRQRPYYSATLKRFYLDRKNAEVELRPANRLMKSQFIPSEIWKREGWQIEGIVIAVLRLRKAMRL